MKNTKWHRGGFIADAIEQNRSEEWDSVTGTYTAWDESGKVVTTRGLTADEVQEFVISEASAAVAMNETNLRGKARDALSSNRDYLALPAYPASPTAAQRDAAIRAIRDQVDALTRQANGLIRLNLSQLDDISDS